MNNVKIWFQRAIRSRTIWFNALVAGLSALEGVLGVLQPFIPGNIFAYITVILVVGNPVIRTLTNQAWKDK